MQEIGSMEMSEWTALEGIPQAAEIDRVVDDWEGFRVIVRDLNDDELKTRIAFDDLVSYRWIHGGSSRILEDRSGPKAIGFFRTNKSEYIEWIRSASGVKKFNNELFHYCVRGLYSRLDILSIVSPDIVLLSA